MFRLPHRAPLGKDAGARQGITNDSSDSTTFWIGTKKYITLDAEALRKFRARILVRGGGFQVVEGDSRERHVIIEFESYKTALACYHSPEYQFASKFRKAAADTDLVIVKGAE
jgi:uncharacterized protein (DUF1330 family)